MALVPHALVEQLFQKQREQEQLVTDSPVVQLNKLDDQMKSVLDQNGPADQLAVLYNKLQQQFNALRDAVVNKKPLDLEEPLEVMHDVTDNMDKRYVKRAKSLLEKIEHFPEVKVNDNGEVSFNGRTIPGSNIVDLVQTFTKPGRKNAAKPKGWNELGQALLKHNVPRNLITNKVLWNDVEVELPEQPIARRKSMIPVINNPIRKAINRVKPRWNPY